MNNSSGDKWPGWVGYNHNPGTGWSDFRVHRRRDLEIDLELDDEQPLRHNTNTWYNPVTREKIVVDIWRVVSDPVRLRDPAAGPVTNRRRSPSTSSIPQSSASTGRSTETSSPGTWAPPTTSEPRISRPACTAS
jgi:hypothetical protein